MNVLNHVRKLLWVAMLWPLATMADQALIESVHVESLGNDRFRIDVTLRHADEGWDHYANRWIVVDGEGRMLGERVLFHPHVNEQPFTRSTTIEVPTGVSEVFIHAFDSVHGESQPYGPIRVQP